LVDVLQLFHLTKKEGLEAAESEAAAAAWQESEAAAESERESHGPFAAAATGLGGSSPSDKSQSGYTWAATPFSEIILPLDKNDLVVEDEHRIISLGKTRIMFSSIVERQEFVFTLRVLSQQNQKSQSVRDAQAARKLA